MRTSATISRICALSSAGMTYHGAHGREVAVKVQRPGIEPQIQRDADGVPRRVWVSAQQGLGLDLLREAMAELLGDDLFVGTLKLPQRLGRMRGQLFDRGAVQSESHDEEGVSLLEVRLQRVELHRLISREGLDPEEFFQQHTLQ